MTSCPEFAQISRRWWPSPRSVPIPSARRPAPERGGGGGAADGGRLPGGRGRHAGGGPAVIGRYPAPPGMPTVCLYAHHDVQPTGDDGLVDQPAVRGDPAGRSAVRPRLQRRQGRVRRAPRGVCAPSPGVRRSASRSSSRARRRSAPRPWRSILADHRDQLAADVYVIADSGNWAVGEPAFTTTLRGLADCVVEVRTLDHAVHSGAYGGVAPDALTALCRLLATLHDDEGNVAIAGLHHGTGPELEYPADRLRAESGVLEGVDYLGDGSVVERLWHRPAVAVHSPRHHPDRPGVEHPRSPAPGPRSACGSLPATTPAAALQCLRDHLESHTPWGAQVTVTDGDTGEPAEIPFAGPVAEAARAAFAAAWGRRTRAGRPGRLDPARRGVRRGVPRRGRSWSPRSAIPTRVRTASTSRCTWATSRRPAWPRPSSSRAWPTPAPAPPPSPPDNPALRLAFRFSAHGKWAEDQKSGGDGEANWFRPVGPVGPRIPWDRSCFRV